MFSRYLSVSLALSLFGLCLYWVAAEQPRKDTPNIVIISVESLRHDMISKENSPNLLEAAASGFHFTNHRAVSGWTGSNIVSLLTGLTPFAAGVHTRGQSVSADQTLPLEQLKMHGYVVQGLQPFMAVELYKNLGLELADSGLDPKLWLAEKKIANHPFVLWYHYLKTHLPYPGEITNDSPLSPAQKSKLEKVKSQATIYSDEASYTIEDRQFIKQLQTPAVKEFDQWFGNFWTFFKKGGLYRDTILVVTADHGDEHGERGMVGHASTTLAGHLHEEIVRIPLFIWLPDRVAPKTVDTDRPSSHTDIMTTILPLLEITPETRLEGQNLLLPPDYRSWYGMTSSGGFNEPDPLNIRYFSYSYLENDWKIHLKINRNNQETGSLYYLKTDPHEQQDVAAAKPQLYEKLKDKLHEKISTKIHRPVAGQEFSKSVAIDSKIKPSWLRPANSGTFSFKQLPNEVVLRWTGDKDHKYIVEYVAGLGDKKIRGSIEVTGNEKNFGKIDRHYWETWIVPYRRFKLRVRRIDQREWSPWLKLRVQP